MSDAYRLRRLLREVVEHDYFALLYREHARGCRDCMKGRSCQPGDALQQRVALAGADASAIREAGEICFGDGKEAK